MLHEPAQKDDSPDLAGGYKAKLGVQMFIVYALVYLGFVAIGLFSIETYETIIVFGLNLAVVYGFGLIVFALVLALIYNHMCATKEAEMNGAPAQAADNASETKEGGSE